MLLHKDNAGNTPIDYAFSEKNGQPNKKILNLIMQYMAQLNPDDLLDHEQIGEHFCKMLTYESFVDFLDRCFYVSY